MEIFFRLLKSPAKVKDGTQSGLLNYFTEHSCTKVETHTLTLACAHIQTLATATRLRFSPLLHVVINKLRPELIVFRKRLNLKLKVRIMQQGY